MHVSMHWKHALVAGVWAALLPAAQAQTFKLQCAVEGRFPEPASKAQAARVTVELQAIGRNLYFKVLGPAPFEMWVSTLVTEDYKGENLTSATHLGARREDRRSQQQSEILIDRSNMELAAHHDVGPAGRAQRFSYTGKCRPA